MARLSGTNSDAPAKGRLPVVFAGHGSPMNALHDNRWSRGFASLAELTPRPSAILAISAHWYGPGTFLSANTSPRTIHDFFGFPDALYEIEYPAPGRPDLAAQVVAALGRDRAALSTEWGLDHGTWSVLRWMYPGADIPVVQLSIDRTLSPRQHLDLGRSLSDLRDQGVLILGSGNVVHNLRDALRRLGNHSTETPGWAARFDATVAAALTQRDLPALLDLWPGTEDGRMAHPTPDHWLPLLYVVGAAHADDPIAFPIEGFDVGSLSMRSVVFGA